MDAKSAAEARGQIIGSKCEVCGERVAIALQATQCLGCGVVAHTGCLEDTSRCPGCKKELAATRRQAETRAAEESSEHEHRGQSWVVAITVTHVVLVAFAIAAALLGQSAAGGYWALLRVPESAAVAALLFFLWRGDEWSAKALALLDIGETIFALATSIVILSDEPLMGAIGIGMAIVLLGSAGILLASADLRAFLAIRRERVRAAAAAAQ